ncbi:hypothetical protein C8J57DRAFT_1676152, partial [Mycena rebaudengoi]
RSSNSHADTTFDFTLHASCAFCTHQAPTIAHTLRIYILPDCPHLPPQLLPARIYIHRYHAQLSRFQKPCLQIDPVLASVIRLPIPACTHLHPIINLLPCLRRTMYPHLIPLHRPVPGKQQRKTTLRNSRSKRKLVHYVVTHTLPNQMRFFASDSAQSPDAVIRSQLAISTKCLNKSARLDVPPARYYHCVSESTAEEDEEGDADIDASKTHTYYVYPRRVITDLRSIADPDCPLSCSPEDLRWIGYAYHATTIIAVEVVLQQHPAETAHQHGCAGIARTLLGVPVECNCFADVLTETVSSQKLSPSYSSLGSPSRPGSASTSP